MSEFETAKLLNLVGKNFANYEKICLDLPQFSGELMLS
jgi:hypothetical protein